MDIDFIEYLQTKIDHAEEHGYKIGHHASKIVSMLINNNGKCPCKPDSTFDETCPCPGHHEEIAKNGHCKCNLFLKGD